MSTNASIIERRTIHWPDQDQRFFGNSPVRSIALHLASPPPQEEIILSRATGRKINPPLTVNYPPQKPGRKVGTMPKCTNPGGHNMQFNGHDTHTKKLKMRCSLCLRHRYATEAEVAELEARKATVKPVLPLPTRFRTALPDCGHGAWKRVGKDRFGRARKRCTVEGCGRTMLA